MLHGKQDHRKYQISYIENFKFINFKRLITHTTNNSLKTGMLHKQTQLILTKARKPIFKYATKKGYLRLSCFT